MIDILCGQHKEENKTLNVVICYGLLHTGQRNKRFLNMARIMKMFSSMCKKKNMET
jgi:hypothetical protein